MPVGTKGTVKSLHPDEVRGIVGTYEIEPAVESFTERVPAHATV